FAKRGMGLNATSPSSSFTSGVHEAYDVPDSLQISPLVILSSGLPGGPFTPNPGYFSLTNIAATNAINWSLSVTDAWLDVFPFNGSLAIGATANIAVSVNGLANNFAAGIRSAVLLFTNLTSGVTQSRTFKLAVVGQNMFDDFEPDIDLSQWSEFGGI